MSNNTPLPSSFDDNPDFYLENRWQKFTRRLKEEPLIPLGLTLTCMALYGAAKSVRAGDHERTNRMFRARIYAQGFTILAMVVGSIYWKSDRQKRKEFENLVTERNAQAKRDAWVRELEARDEEEKALRAKRERMMAREKKTNMDRSPTAEGNATNNFKTDPEDKGTGFVQMVQKTLGSGGKKDG